MRENFAIRGMHLSEVIYMYMLLFHFILVHISILMHIELTLVYCRNQTDEGLGFSFSLACDANITQIGY